MRKLAALALILVSSSCGPGSISDPDAPPHQGSKDDALPPDPTGPGATSDPTLPPTETPAPVMVYDGRYALTSHVDLAGSGVLGDTLSQTLIELSNFHDNPAGTILDLMALYDVPYFSQVWDILPGLLKDPFEDWLNDYLFAALFDAVPAIDQIVQVIDDIASVSRNVELETELALEPPTAAGAMHGQHDLKGLAFTLWGDRTEIPVPSYVTDITSAETRALVTPKSSPNPSFPNGLLEIERHGFAVPYGDMLMDLLAQQIFEPEGASSLAGYLNVLIDCDAIAQGLGDECVLVTCVSDVVSVDDLSGFCEDGLNILGFVVEDAVRSLKLDLIDFTDGRCEMHDRGDDDPVGDFKISRIANGTWGTVVTLNGQTRTIPAPFEGRRVADQ